MEFVEFRNVILVVKIVQVQDHLVVFNVVRALKINLVIVKIVQFHCLNNILQKIVPKDVSSAMISIIASFVHLSTLILEVFALKNALLGTCYNTKTIQRFLNKVVKRTGIY